MRRDFDYVAFADYKKDMDELSAFGAAVAAHWREKAERAQRLLAAAALSAGGKLLIDYSVLCDLQSVDLSFEQELASRDIIVRGKWV